jgi:hypothetical protein
VTKQMARNKAQWEADVYKRPVAVVISSVYGYATEPLTPHIPESEIVEICLPPADREEEENV